ncbi:MAG: MoaF N-terminal domain-containing protein [Candidatus Andeanibacterium colombiense]|uniref:MoaF N-terminal domain-containing protein n=1 Tax=Candidatus Andeanibacterium colombiense TaxID=3121345 RepID=A0AAJ5X736_9SPHN|nr:MAG: MoaF N-terminal domain-containing protein [Sphingomonadaceae bacterium]
MPGPAYPKVQLYRYNWTQLSEAAIGAALGKVAASGPKSTSPADSLLAGTTLRIVTDDDGANKGPLLSYRFTSAHRLSLSENGGTEIAAGYGALRLDDLVLFAHLIPGTLRGYAVVIDERTGLATAFELWFAGQGAKREVSRAVWQGYVAQDGADAPPLRHRGTNRIEGKGLYWKTDSGDETLDFYPSMAYSHWVELTRLDGKQGYCAPSDYIQVDDRFYLYTRTEAEFSGIFTLYAMDLDKLEQVGLRLGFNAADELEFQIFRGTGEWLGQIAQFEKFGDISGGAPKPRAGPGQGANIDPDAKGARGVYRPLATMPKLTKAQVDKAVAENTRVFAPRTGAGSGAAGMATNGLAAVGWLAGKNFTLRYDGGPAVEYKVVTAEELKWRKDGGRWVTARYQAWEPAPGVILFGHVLEGEANHAGHSICADFHQGLVTTFKGTLNGPYFANEAVAETLFGTIEMAGIKSPGALRHHRTNELLGRAITWNYAPGLTSMHLYSTPGTVSWIIFTDSGAGGLEWSGPGDFVKIRDQLYFAYWLEDACNGTLGTIVINLRTMHDAGIGYHCGTEGLSMSQVGAHARHAGKFDIDRFFKQSV